MTSQFVMESPIGRLAIHTSGGKVTQVDYGVRSKVTDRLTDPLHKQIKQQVDHYFRNADTAFELPLELQGTPFQLKVWRALQKIPVSKTLSYGDLAERLHTSARAVGNACRANPIPLIIPCHRIVAKNNIGGFSGATTGSDIDRKRWLLKHEGAL